MGTFSFSRFKSFVAKHYAENGRRYKLTLIALVAVELFIRTLPSWVVDADVVSNLSELLRVMTYAFMVTNLTVWSLGGMERSRDIIDMTLPVNTIERFAFAWLNSLLLGVVVPSFLLSGSAVEMSAVLSYLVPAHSLSLLVATIGSKRGFGYAMILFFAVMIGFSTLFEYIDIFPMYGVDRFFSLMPTNNAVYMSNVYENVAGRLVYRWDMTEPIARWIHFAYNGAIVLTLYAAAYLKLRERRL